MREFQLLSFQITLYYVIYWIHRCFGAWSCFQLPSALMQLSCLHPLHPTMRPSANPALSSQPHAFPSQQHVHCKMASHLSHIPLPRQRWHCFPAISSLPRPFQRLLPCMFLAILKRDRMGEDNTSTANTFQEENHLPKAGLSEPRESWWMAAGP